MSCPEFPKIDTLFDRGGDFTVDTDRVRRPEFLVPREWLVTEKIDGTNVRVSLEQCREPLRFCGHEGGQPWSVHFYGRTENSQMPTFLLDHLQRTFTLEKMQNLWRGKPSCDKCGGLGQFDSGEPKTLTRSYAGHRDYQCDCVETYPIALYGEGYGARIQKGGGDYRRDGGVSFRLIDVLVGGTWLRRADVEDAAKQLGIEPVPLMRIVERASPAMAVSSCHAVTADIVDDVRDGLDSIVAAQEGTVGTKAEGVVAFTDPPLFNSRGQRLMWKLKTRDFAAGKR